MTNGDRIRQMSNEELAEFIERKTVCACSICFYRLSGNDGRGICDVLCKEGIKAYLESEEE